jgi:hypothetical protein
MNWRLPRVEQLILCSLIYSVHDVVSGNVAMEAPNTPARGSKRPYERDSEKCNCCRAKKTKVGRALARMSRFRRTDSSCCSAFHTIEIGPRDRNASRANEVDKSADQMSPSVAARSRLTLPTQRFCFRDRQSSTNTKTPYRTLCPTKGSHPSNPLLMLR